MRQNDLDNGVWRVVSLDNMCLRVVDLDVFRIFRGCVVRLDVNICGAFRGHR